MEQSRREVRHETVTKEIKDVIAIWGRLTKEKNKEYYKRVDQAQGAGAPLGANWEHHFPNIHSVTSGW